MLYILGVNYIWQYSNPVIVLSAICSFMPFLYRSYFNKRINWIAKSTLSVYIIHVTAPVYYVVVEFDKYLLSNYNYSTYLILALCCITIIFVLSILYDKTRLLFTDRIYNLVVNAIGYFSHGNK